MNLIESIASVAVMSAFLSSVGCLIAPVSRVLESARADFELARSITFLDGTFRAECARSDRDVARWKRCAAVIAGFEDADVIPCRVRGSVRALRAVCAIGTARFEILAECGDE